MSNYITRRDALKKSVLGLGVLAGTSHDVDQVGVSVEEELDKAY